MDVNSLPRRILAARAGSAPPGSVVSSYMNILEELRLPGLTSILQKGGYNKTAWNKANRRQVAIESYLQFQQDAAAYPIGSCSLNILKPAPHWSVTRANTKLTRINNFRIRLLVGCSGLESDAARFRRRKFDVTPNNSTCRLCNAEQESAEHFVASCSALQETRLQLISDAPPTISSQLPDPSESPTEFTDFILGVVWLEDLDFQVFCIQFLQKLRELRLDKLIAAELC